MLKALKNRLDNRKGFTLIELIVVIAIIAILAAVLIPQMAGFTQKAKNSNTVSEAKNIATAFAAMAAEKPSTTIAAAGALDPTDDKTLLDALKVMAGDFKGTITVTTAISATGGVNFTYANGTYSVTVTNGQVVTS